MAKRRTEHADRSDADVRRNLDDALDEALQDTFPGSDPVSVVQPPPSKYDKVIKREPAQAD